MGDSFRTVGDSFSTEEVVQYSGGITLVLWRIFSSVEITAVHVGDSFSTVGDTFSTVEVVQYRGG